MILHFQIDFNNIDPTSLQKHYDKYVYKHLPPEFNSCESE